MKIQRFEADELQKALRMAQQALGPDAVILQTRRVPTGGIRGLLGARRVEVLAAVDLREQTAEQGGARRSALGAPRERPLLGARSAEPGAPSEASAEPGAASEASLERSSPGPWQAEWEDLRREVAELRLQLLRAGMGASGGARSPERPLRGAPSAEAGAAFLAEQARRRLEARPIELREGACTAVALVGPTGIGKTTTLAKLAAVATRLEQKKVAFVTVDTYRIGAVEQLETYARLQDIPVSVVYSPADMRAARDRYRDFDLLLVDTTGRSQRNAEQIQALGRLLEPAELDEIHLLLEASASARTLGEVLSAFQRLRPTHLLLSKLDEAAQLEDVLAAALEGGLPLSYVTMGQRVPEDLAPADVEQLTEWLLMES